ncbi:hypothetical protein BGZ54_000737 [Gamsiella multidivaricata]|nr:hypothetical protein BGZ54_000737 [Gamsiella multidivaricata]
MLFDFAFKPSLAPGKTLNLVEQELGSARETKDEDSEISLAHCDYADRLLSSLKGKVKRSPDSNGTIKKGRLSDMTEQTLRDRIANAYLDHANLAADLGFPDKAKKSRMRADKWGGPGPKKPAATQLKSDRAPDVATVPSSIFPEDIRPPAVAWTFPEPDGRLTDTPQLVSCLGLLKQGPGELPEDVLEPIARKWLKATLDNADERTRLEIMATDLIRAFTQDEIKDKKAVAEVLCLAPVLEEEDFRFLLKKFVDTINGSMILDVGALRGLAQLIQSAASQSYLHAQDLIDILGMVSTRLKGTHEQSPDHIFELTVTVSSVLNAMADTKVTGLKRVELHEPLLAFLGGLQGSDDPYLKFYASYAFQALLCVPDDESPWQATVRRTTKVVKGISGLVSAVKGLDLNGFMTGLQNIQQGLEDISQVVDLAKMAYEGVTSVYEGEQDMMDSLKEGLTYNRRRAWYSALRGADTLIEGGELAKFKTLVCGAACRRELAFQWGVCQRLGNLAANPLWPKESRQGAVMFLGEIYRDDRAWGHWAPIKAYILDILKQLCILSNNLPGAAKLLKNLATDGDATKQDIYRSREKAEPSQHVLKAGDPEFASPSLLDRVQKRTDVEADLRRIARLRVKERGGTVYVPPMAKANILASDDVLFPLIPMVNKFLAGSDKVLLLVGDSGAGKTTFNRELDHKLWQAYKPKVGRIPLLISLPAIERPEKDLIAKHLRVCEFSESQIRELKSREFVIICDGYDESQQTHNLYEANGFNIDGNWKAQMVVSCRSEHLGQDYRDLFQPSKPNPSGSDCFQQAVLVPFSMNQVKDYIKEYVKIKRPLWEASDYEGVLNQIPSLQELVKNPFLLTLSLEVLPRLTDPGQRLAANKITRVLLYDEFMAQWLERNKKRLATQELSDQEKEAFGSLSDDGFTQQGLNYLKDLSAAVYKEQGGNPVVDYSKARDIKTWKEKFFGRKDDEMRLLRKAIPLTRNGGRFGFIHRSILEYGVSRAICEPQKGAGIKLEAVDDNKKRRKSIDSSFSFEIEEATEEAVEAAAAAQGPNPDSPLVKRSFVKDISVLQFLAERIDQEPVFKQQLLDYIEASKTNKKWRIAAANAITILVRANVRFLNEDFSGIQIPGSDLSHGFFDRVKLQGADLRKTTLQGCWLRQSDLSHSQMTRADFGEWPLLKDEVMGSSVMYTPDGKTLIASTESGKIYLYKTSNWTLLNVLEGHYTSTSVACMILSQDGSKIVSAGHDQSIKVWNVEDGRNLASWEQQSCCHETLALAPARKGHPERLLASGGEGCSVQLWDIETGERGLQLDGHTGPPVLVQFSPDEGRVLASGGEDYTVRLWDPRSGKCLHVIDTEQETMYRFIFVLGGEQIVWGYYSGIVKMWDVATGSCVRTLEAHTARISYLALSPNGQYMATMSRAGTAKIWDSATGVPGPVLKNANNTVGSDDSELVFSPNSLQIATTSGGHMRTIQLWDTKTGTARMVLSGHTDSINKIVYAPDGQQIASTSGDGSIRLWAMDARRSTNRQEKEPARHTENVNYLFHLPLQTGDAGLIKRQADSGLYEIAVSPCGTQIAVSVERMPVQLWDAVTGQCQFTLDQGHSWGEERSFPILQVVYSADGQTLAAFTNVKTIDLWNYKTGSHIRSLEAHDCEGGTKAIVFLPANKGNQMASLGYTDQTVKIWDVGTGSCVRELKPGIETDLLVAAGDGTKLITASQWKRVVNVWEVASGSCLLSFELNAPCQLAMISFSPCGSLAVIPSQNPKRDGDLIIWDLVTGTRRWRLRAHEGMLRFVGFSPDGSRLVTNGLDGTVRVWDLLAGKQMTKVPNLGYGDVSSCLWDPLVVIEGKETKKKEYMSFTFGYSSGDVAKWELVPIEGYVAVAKEKLPPPPVDPSDEMEEQQDEGNSDDDHTDEYDGEDEDDDGEDEEDGEEEEEDEDEDGKEDEDDDGEDDEDDEDEDGEDEVDSEDGEDEDEPESEIEYMENYESDEETEEQIIVEEYQRDPYEAVLRWTTVTGRLMADGTMIEGVQGLTRANAKLLQQNGTQGTPVPPKGLASVANKVMHLNSAMSLLRTKSPKAASTGDGPGTSMYGTNSGFMPAQPSTGKLKSLVSLMKAKNGAGHRRSHGRKVHGSSGNGPLGVSGLRERLGAQKEINAARKLYGIQTLKWNDTLFAGAEAHVKTCNAEINTSIKFGEIVSQKATYKDAVQEWLMAESAYRNHDAKTINAGSRFTP